MPFSGLSRYVPVGGIDSIPLGGISLEVAKGTYSVAI